MTKETRQQVQYLLARYINGQASPQEEALLFELINKEEGDQDGEEMLEELMMLEEADSHYSRERWQPVVEAIIKSQVGAPEVHPGKLKGSFFRIPAWGIAASLLLLLSIAAWLWFNERDNDQPGIVQQPITIAPGKSGAVLTLSDGSAMVLDSLGNGVVALQNGTKIVLKNGELTYQPDSDQSGEVVYNTMSTPRGRQFQLSLPDGSKVWLNAESSIKYPVQFSGNQRKVEVTGEAYFEVAKKAGQPFIASINKQTAVEVLGTHFNINAYGNEPVIAATLLEGAIKFTYAANQTMLRPGQQAQAGQSGSISVVNNADINKIMAWKNGAFNFEGASLEEVMRQLERWYDIKVVYEKGIPQKEFVGEIGRNISLAELLKGLEGTGVHFRLEGRTLIVLP